MGPSSRLDLGRSGDSRSHREKIEDWNRTQYPQRFKPQSPESQPLQCRITDKYAKKIFGKREGHLPDTPSNRKLLEDIANNPKTTLGLDQHGNIWSGKTLSDGTQVWTQSRNGNVINGGLNKIPKQYNPNTGLSAQE